MIFSYLVFWAFLVFVLILVLGKSIMAFRSEGKAHREPAGGRVLIGGGFSFGRDPGFKMPSRPVLNPNGISKGN